MFKKKQRTDGVGGLDCIELSGRKLAEGARGGATAVRRFIVILSFCPLVYAADFWGHSWEEQAYSGGFDRAVR